jgi:hypothetical protein
MRSAWLLVWRGARLLGQVRGRQRAPLERTRCQALGLLTRGHLAPQQ